MTTLTYNNNNYSFELHGGTFVCVEADNGRRYWWDLLQIDDTAEPAFVQTHPHSSLPAAVEAATHAFISGVKGKQRHLRRTRGALLA